MCPVQIGQILGSILIRLRTSFEGSRPTLSISQDIDRKHRYTLVYCVKLVVEVVDIDSYIGAFREDFDSKKAKPLVALPPRKSFVDDFFRGSSIVVRF
jgi:hypothetical protein